MSDHRVRLYDMIEFKEAIKNYNKTPASRGTAYRACDLSLDVLMCNVEDEVGLKKDYIPSISKIDGEPLGLSFTISDEQVDRDRDTVRVAGWSLKNYKKNPIVLWAHSSSQLPIAKSVVRVDGDKLVADAVFTPRDLYPFGHMVFQMYEQRFLNATSVGFKPEKWEYIDQSADDESRRGGVNFLKQELLEWSAVPIPANPRALMRAHEVGIDLAPLTEWCCEFLDLDPKTVKVVARQEVEAVWKKLASHPTYVEVNMDEDREAVIPILKPADIAATVIASIGGILKSETLLIKRESLRKKMQGIIDSGSDSKPLTWADGTSIKASDVLACFDGEGHLKTLEDAIRVKGQEILDQQLKLTPEEEALIRVLSLTISWGDESVELQFQTLTQKLLAQCKTTAGEHDLALKKKLGVNILKRIEVEKKVEKVPSDFELDEIEFEAESKESDSDLGEIDFGEKASDGLDLDAIEEDLISVEERKRIAREIFSERITKILGEGK